MIATRRSWCVQSENSHVVSARRLGMQRRRHTVTYDGGVVDRSRPALPFCQALSARNGCAHRRERILWILLLQVRRTKPKVELVGRVPLWIASPGLCIQQGGLHVMVSPLMQFGWLCTNLHQRLFCVDEKDKHGHCNLEIGPS